MRSALVSLLLNVKLEVYHLTINKISYLKEKLYTKEDWIVTWNAAENSSGIYIARAQIGYGYFNHRLMLIK